MWQMKLQPKFDHMQYKRNLKQIAHEERQANKATILVRKRALFLLMQRDYQHYLEELESLGETFHNERK
nr:hypothetical protein BaRGS_005878 [Batillaria attramentaria]